MSCCSCCCRRSSSSISKTDQHTSPIYYILSIIKYFLHIQLVWAIFGLSSWAAVSSLFSLISVILGYRALWHLTPKVTNSTSIISSSFRVRSLKFFNIFCLFVSIASVLTFFTISPLVIWPSYLQDDTMNCHYTYFQSQSATCSSDFYEITLSNMQNWGKDDDWEYSDGSIQLSSSYIIFISILSPIFALGNMLFNIVQLQIWIKFDTYSLTKLPIVNFNNNNPESSGINFDNPSTTLLTPSMYSVLQQQQQPLLLNNDPHQQYINTIIHNEVTRQLQLQQQQQYGYVQPPLITNAVVPQSQRIHGGPSPYTIPSAPSVDMLRSNSNNNNDDDPSYPNKDRL